MNIFYRHQFITIVLFHKLMSLRKLLRYMICLLGFFLFSITLEIRFLNLIFFHVNLIAVFPCHHFFSTCKIFLCNIKLSKTICINVSHLTLCGINSLGNLWFNLFMGVSLGDLILILILYLIDCWWILVWCDVVASFASCSFCSSTLTFVIQVHTTSEFT